jgi:uncharacterized membrane protein (DUF485 family)
MRASSAPIDRQQAQQTHLLTLKRVGMAAATAFVTANIWTGCPLLAVWIGSQADGTKTLSMGAVFVVVIVLAVLVFAMALLLTWLNNVYDQITGRERVERRSAWLRSMRAESERHVSRRVGVTALERIVMLNVYVAVILLVLWYVLYAAPPAPTLCTMHC